MGIPKPAAGDGGAEKPAIPDRGTPRDRTGQGGLQGLNSPEKLADRVADVTVVLDALDQIEKEIPVIPARE